MRRGVVGITLCDGWLRGCEIVAGEPNRFGEIALDPGIVELGVVVDETAMAAGFRLLWAAAGFASKKVVIGLDAEAAMIRRVVLPPMAPAEVAEAVVYDIADVLGFPTDEAVIDFAVLDSPGVEGREVEGGGVEVLVVAVKTDVIDGFRRSVAGAGLGWVRAELAPAAGVALLDLADVAEGEIGAIATVGELTTTVSVHDGSGLLFARVIMTGVGGTASLSHELENQLADIEKLRSGQTTDPTGNVATSADAPGVGVVVEGVRRTLHYYTSDIDRRPFATLVLSGPRSRASGLAQRMAEALPHVAVSELATGHTVEDEPERFDLALGVALLAGADQPASTPLNRRLSLVPVADVRRQQDRRVLVVGLAVALLVGALAILDGTRRSEANVRQREVVAMSEQSVGRLRGELARLGEVQALSNDVEQRRALLRDAGSGDIDLAAVLGQIAETMPADTSITALRLTRSTAGPAAEENSVAGAGSVASVTFDGVATDLDGVGRWVEQVAELPIIENLWLRQAVSGPFGAGGSVVAVFSVDASISPAAASARLQSDEPLGVSS